MLTLRIVLHVVDFENYCRAGKYYFTDENKGKLFQKFGSGNNCKRIRYKVMTMSLHVEQLREAKRLSMFVFV